MIGKKNLIFERCLVPLIGAAGYLSEGFVE
jgi:hypothetical protein